MMTSPIFKAEKETLTMLRSEKSSNLSLYVLTIAKSMNIELRIDTFKEEEWQIKGGITPIRHISN